MLSSKKIVEVIPRICPLLQFSMLKDSKIKWKRGVVDRYQNKEKLNANGENKKTSLLLRTSLDVDQNVLNKIVSNSKTVQSSVMSSKERMSPHLSVNDLRWYLYRESNMFFQFSLLSKSLLTLSLPSKPLLHRTKVSVSLCHY